MSNNNDIFNKDNLEKEAPLLARIPKRNPYTVPEDYFDALPSSILEKVRQNKAVPEISAKIFWLFSPQWMIAILVCIIGFTFYTRSNTPATLETLTAQVADSAIYQNLQNNIDYVDASALEDALQNDNTTIVPLRSDSTNNQQDIENYLMNHNVDATDIENEL